MHGLINRSLQCFLSDTYGKPLWLDVARASGLESESFEPMMLYDDAIIFDVIETAARKLSKPEDQLLEDLGTYLVSNPKVESLRRLLRFSGVTFVDFLHSLDDLHDRARLAVPELDVPKLELLGHQSTGGFTLYCRWPHRGAGHVIVGVLRAMADEYGALVFMEYEGGASGCEMISIKLLETSFAEGRSFSLAADRSQE